jgi:hypothetical protein
LNISGLGLKSFLVFFWTLFAAAGMLFHAAFALVVSEYTFRLGPGLVEFRGRTAIFVCILVGVCGLSAAALLHWSSRLGARILLLYSLCASVTLGGGLVLDLLFQFHYQIDRIDYVMRVGIVVAFLFTAWWCWKRAFPGGTNELSILPDRTSAPQSSR